MLKNPDGNISNPNLALGSSPVIEYTHLVSIKNNRY
jgi:hypothetical protein